MNRTRTGAIEGKASGDGRRWVAGAAGLLAGLVLLPGLAGAQVVEPRFELRLDYFQAEYDSSVRFDSVQLGLGTTLDLESDLGVEDSAGVERVNLQIRTGRRGHIVVDHVSMDRNGMGQVSRDFVFGDFLFQANADVASSVSTDFTAVGWRFDFARDPITEVALSLSVAQIEIDASVRGPVGIVGGPSIEVEEHGTIDGPVPMLGLHVARWIGHGRLSGYVRYLSVSDLDGWSGDITDAGFGLDWFFTANLGLSAGYSATEINGENTSTDLDGLTKADSSFSGFRAGVILSF